VGQRARGPLLIIEGEKDHTVPWAIANAAYKRQRHNESVTEITQIPNRGRFARPLLA
jgi:non-heme chloroperoxidase